MREIDAIVVHGAWTKPTLDVGVEEIREWHITRGFSDVGYHYVIRRNGKVEGGRPPETPGAHVKGHNKTTLGVCLVGGRDSVPLVGADTEMAKQELQWEFNYSADQMLALIDLVTRLKNDHDVKEVLGHRDYAGVTKRCPGFDVRAFFG